MHECYSCDRAFWTERSLHQHMDALGHWGHECAECGRWFYAEHDLYQHARDKNHNAYDNYDHSEDEDEDESEDDSDYDSNHNYQYDSHMTVSSYSYPCNQCGRSFGTPRGCASHKRDVHGIANAPISCRVCGGTFATGNDLRSHITSAGHRAPWPGPAASPASQARSQATTQPSFRCGPCNTSFATQEALTIHNGDSHRPMPVATMSEAARVQVPEPQGPAQPVAEPAIPAAATRPPDPEPEPEPEPAEPPDVVYSDLATQTTVKPAPEPHALVCVNCANQLPSRSGVLLIHYRAKCVVEYTCDRCAKDNEESEGCSRGAGSHGSDPKDEHIATETVEDGEGLIPPKHYTITVDRAESPCREGITRQPYTQVAANDDEGDINTLCRQSEAQYPQVASRPNSNFETVSSDASEEHVTPERDGKSEGSNAGDIGADLAQYELNMAHEQVDMRPESPTEEHDTVASREKIPDESSPTTETHHGLLQGEIDCLAEAATQLTADQGSDDGNVSTYVHQSVQTEVLDNMVSRATQCEEFGDGMSTSPSNGDRYGDDEDKERRSTALQGLGTLTLTPIIVVEHARPSPSVYDDKSTIYSSEGDKVPAYAYNTATDSESDDCSSVASTSTSTEDEDVASQACSEETEALVGAMARLSVSPRRKSIPLENWQR
ncbi:uncharacterized protein B0I36DRAFT_369168 [Microdochium trichocladiopsis]|uniref:C2H2-type domain-containing protein n=1 Tax=Microdochium trichocladiopsis TaxID=1682393 RepID=A0A9P8XTR0_9PEZI|nr:uncharacterized protein B0I36DRAFT_369168 [Microdochium trichocladiopsis]KAH7014179.1 hypothetical protein B0I36DRAFT_369168 [Microdochium trichocladiopsis]